jgi:Kef-type K+ transport system membrane component KefB
MTEHNVLVFLLALSALLGSARILGELARMLRLPAVVGEIAAGILLGKTVFGRVAPGLQSWMFPLGASQSMIGAYTTVAVVLLLVVVGLEVDLDLLLRRGRSALLTGLLGILLPAASGIALGFCLPESDLVDPTRRLTLALVLGVALSISALPVIAKTLLDLGLFKSDVGGGHDRRPDRMVGAVASFGPHARR